MHAGGCMGMTHLRREVLKRGSLNGVDGELVARVNGRKAARDCGSDIRHKPEG